MCPLLSLSLSGYVIIWEDTLSRSSYCYYSIQCTVPVCVCVCVRSYVPVYLRTCVRVYVCGLELSVVLCVYLYHLPYGSTLSLLIYVLFHPGGFQDEVIRLSPPILSYYLTPLTNPHTRTHLLLNTSWTGLLQWLLLFLHSYL